MPTTDQTSRVGLNAVERIFLHMGWLFREQPIRDFGIDAHVEIAKNGIPTGKLVALQIKSGESYFKMRGSNYVYYGKSRHLDYWIGHSLPVFIVIHNPKSGVTLWQRVERRLVTMGKDGAWSIDIPPTNVLDAKAEPFLSQGIASDAESVRRFRMSLDAPLISKIAASKATFMSVNEWVNKSLNIRGVEFRFDSSDKKTPDIALDYFASMSVGTFMDEVFPWLDYSYEESPDDDGTSELAVHEFSVSLNEIGRAQHTLANYFENGADEREPPERPGHDEDDEEMTDEEWQEYHYRRNTEED